MSDGPSLPRRTFLAGSGLAAVSLFSHPATAQSDKTLADYANADGYIDNDGVVQASDDWRAGVISTSLLRRVIRYWRSGDPVVSEGSANPAQLIDSHIETLGNTSFGLQIDEYQDGSSPTASKQLQFQWDEATQQSQLAESSIQNQAVNVSQLFTQDRQHVDIQENDTQVNQAALPIDKGPVYLDGRELLDQLLIGASLAFDQVVSRGETTLSKYSIADHRRLPEASGHVIGDEEAYIAELEIQWARPDGQLTEVDLYTDLNGSQSLESFQSFEPSLQSGSPSGTGTTPATDHSTVSISNVSPSPDESLSGGSTETFDITVEYDMGGVSPGELKVSVREESWGSIDEIIPVDQQAGSKQISLSEQIESGWDQAKLIVNLYEADSSVAVAGEELSYSVSDSGGGSSQLPDLVTRDVEWSPETPTSKDDVEFRMELENTGNARAESIEPRVFVDGELAYVPPTVDLDPGERQWAVETGSQSFDAGTYTVRAVVDPEDHIEEQDETNNDLERSLTVEPLDETITADLRDVSVESGTYTTGDRVSTTATIENTGNVEHTFFVGYDVVGPAGDTYNNNGDTGQLVTLRSGEQTDVSLTWTVQDDVPDGEYGTIVSVWQESDRDSLTTRLDSSTKDNSFTVSSVEPRPDLAVESLDWTPQSPDESSAVTFEATVRNVGAGRAGDFVVALDIDSQQFDTTLIDELIAGDRRQVTFASWVATDSSTVTVTADPDGATRDPSDSNNSISREISVSQPELQFSVTDVQADASTYDPGEVATTETVLTNAGDAAHDVDVSQELQGPAGETLRKTTTTTVAAGETTTIPSQWALPDNFSAGQYDLQVRVQAQSTTVAETTATSVFAVAEPTGPVGVTIETRTAGGNTVDGVRVTLTPVDGGSRFSAVSSDGLAQFDRLPPGEYELTAASEQLHQQLTYRLIVDGTSNLTRELTFQPTDAVYGTVFNGSGQQHIPGVTVSIPKLQTTAETDTTGEFVLESNIPDGTYEFEITVNPESPVIAASTVDTYTKTRTVGIDRTVSFDVPVDLKAPTNDSSELISEEDKLVTLIVRNLENRDVLFPLEQQFISQYGFIKGIITGIQEFLENTWELITSLDDIPELVDGIINLINTIIDDPSVVFDMISMMINDVLEKQKDDNPFEQNTIDYQTFFASWMLGYGSIKIAILIIGSKGATKISNIAKNSSKINKSINTLNSKVDSGRVPDKLGFNRRIRPCTNLSGASSTTSSDCLDTEELLKIHTLTEAAPAPRLVKYLSDTSRQLRRDNNDSAPNLWKEIQDDGVGAKGNVVENIFAVALRSPGKSPDLLDKYPSTFDEFEIRPRMTTTLHDGGESIAVGQGRVINPSEKAIMKGGEQVGEFEFDPIVVVRNQEGDLEVRDIYEVKSGTSKSPSQAKGEITDALDLIDEYVGRDDVTVGRDNTIGGLPPKIFKNLNRNKAKTVGPTNMNFDVSLGFTAEEIEDTITYIYDNLDVYRSLPEANI